MLFKRAAGFSCTRIQTGALWARQFSGAQCNLSSRKLPALSEIHPIDVEKYQKEQLPSERLSAELEEELKHPIGSDSPAQEGGGNSLIKSFLYGSPKLQKEAQQLERSFSSQLQRGKLVHEFVIHRVKPGSVREYVDLVCETAEKKAGAGPPHAQLIGSWRVVAGGDMDTYIHIWEYDGFGGMHLAQAAMHSDTDYVEYVDRLLPLLKSRESQIVQEFSFWGGTAKPRELGGVFELRMYDLRPGTMAEWEMHWRKGIEYRRKVMEPVGAWFSSIGHLNRVYHLWQFTDLQHRKISRQKSWELSGWAETTHETVKLIDSMQNVILVPMPFSPLR